VRAIILAMKRGLTIRSSDDVASGASHLIRD
jgi:hypothetical protein